VREEARLGRSRGFTLWSNKECEKKLRKRKREVLLMLGSIKIQSERDFNDPERVAPTNHPVRIATSLNWLKKVENNG
jgi:hypothetical protein